MDAFFPSLAFFGVGDGEMILIMVVALIFFGGNKMPEFARGLGKALKEFKRATGDVEREFKRVMEEAENPVTTVKDTFKPLGTIPSINPESLLVDSPQEDPAKAEEPAMADGLEKVEGPAKTNGLDKNASTPAASPTVHLHSEHSEAHLEGEHEYHSDI